MKFVCDNLNDKRGKNKSKNKYREKVVSGNLDDEEKKAENEAKKGIMCNLKKNLYGEKKKEIKNADQKRRKVVHDKLNDKRKNEIKDNDKKRKQVVHGTLDDEDKKAENAAKKERICNFG